MIAAALLSTLASIASLPTLATRARVLVAKMAERAPSRCRVTRCPAFPVRVRWVIRPRCARFQCRTLATVDLASTAELVCYAPWTITRALARRASAAPSARPSTTVLFIRAKTEPSVPRYRIPTAVPALLDSLERPAMSTLTSVNATLASTAAVSTPTDHTSQFLSYYILLYILTLYVLWSSMVRSVNHLFVSLLGALIDGRHHG